MSDSSSKGSSGRIDLVSQEAFEAFEREALGVSPEKYPGYLPDARLARYNAQVGVAAVLAHRDRLKREMPLFPADRVAELPALARGLHWAMQKQRVKPVSDGELAKRTSALVDPRGEMLSSAKGFARRGVFDAAEVKDIAEGNDRYNSAEDVVRLIALFNDHRDAVKGQHPFTKDDFKEWGEHAEFLMANLLPGGAVKPPVVDGRHAKAAPGLWALLLEGYAWVRKAGFYLFDEAEVDRNVPKLLSRDNAMASVAEAEPEGPADEEKK